MAKIDFLEAKYFDSTPDLKANKKTQVQSLPHSQDMSHCFFYYDVISGKKPF